jgi:hypothetical protein
MGIEKSCCWAEAALSAVAPLVVAYGAELLKTTARFGLVDNDCDTSGCRPGGGQIMPIMSFWAFLTELRHNYRQTSVTKHDK